MLSILHTSRLIRQTSSPEQPQRHRRIPPISHAVEAVGVNSDRQFVGVFHGVVGDAEFFAE